MTRKRSRHPASQHETKGTNVTTTTGPCPAERTAQLRVGFVGAGKIGFALGLHLFRSGANISGYVSRSSAGAQWAAQCTNSVSFSSLQALLDSTDLIFITVPDGAIAQVAGEVAAAAENGLAGKIVCHASGRQRLTSLPPVARRRGVRQRASFVRRARCATRHRGPNRR